MVWVFMMSIYFRRNIPPSTSLCVALLLCLINDPLAPVSLSFWLSFVAVAVLIYGVSGRISPSSGRWQLGLSQYIVFIGLLPVMAMAIGELSLVSPLVNGVAVPVFSFIIVPLNLIAFLLTMFSDAAALLIWQGLDDLLTLFIDKLVQLNDSVIGLPVVIPDLPPVLSSLAIVGGIIALLPRGMPHRYLGFLLILPLFIYQPAPLAKGDLTMTVLDVGQGLSVVVQTRQHSLIYDVGASYDDGYNMASVVLTPFLAAKGIESVDTLILSHADNDHAGGWSALVDAVAVSDVYYGEFIPDLPASAQRCRRGQRWRWDDVSFEFINAEAVSTISSAKVSANNLSCVLKISTASQQFLLPGDIESVVEYQLVDTLASKLKAEVLIAPHHGSGTSSSWPFIKTVQPLHVVFSSGYRNRFAHPRDNISNRYEQMGANIHQTNRHGAITFKVVAGELLTPAHYRRINQRYWW
jgi:competence protein ComEC